MNLEAVRVEFFYGPTVQQRGVSFATWRPQQVELFMALCFYCVSSWRLEELQGEGFGGS